MSILDDIAAHKRREIERLSRQDSCDDLRRRAEKLDAPPDFVRALRSVPFGLIAEVKRRSPSAGIIRDPFDPAAIARAYERAGAQAVSVLMDAHYFGGGEAHFRAVREAVDLPLLYKEFVLDEWQVWHAASLGASAVLLIAELLNEPVLAALRTSIESAGMTALIEAHSAETLDKAVRAGASCVGINNRDLKTFDVRLETSRQLAGRMPDAVTRISESGIRTPADPAMLRNAGYHGMLVGEQLLRQDDLEAAVRALTAGVRSGEASA